MFPELPSQHDFPAHERLTLQFWESNSIYQRSLQQRQRARPFIFYEGPPTANGMPHPGHCLTRAIKDLFPRYRTMCGYYCERKAGWDTHGLPVEREVCKDLGIRTKQQIESYGVERFVHKCIESVFKYTREWEEMTRRLAFWVNLDEAYATYHQSYVESVWWGLKALFERGMLYQRYKVLWWWAQGGTALSAGEVGEGYRDVDDPSVFVRFPIVPGAQDSGVAGDLQNASLLVWTTTPWTLPSNTFAAVHRDLDYAVVHDTTTGGHLIFAAALVETVAKKCKADSWTVVRTVRGADLVGLRYVPPFDIYHKSLGDKTAATIAGASQHVAWRVLHADFVSLDAGTGLVHEAPAFGEVDFALLQEERKRFVDPESVPLLCAVAPDGTFTSDAGAAYAGRWVKEADRDIVRELKDRGLLLHQESYRHPYPFCPQSPEDALIQYPRQSWFVRTSQFKGDFLANNSSMNWLPREGIQGDAEGKGGRFGDFLANNVDWALSRERYWGTPLPIWVCEKSGRMEAIGSFAELQGKPGATDGGFWQSKVAEHRAAGHAEMPTHLQVHKPYIDAWTYDSPYARDANDQCARMRRVPEVIDCWWDAGSMPYAQWGFPHAPGSKAKMQERWPADFISEAIDQTRGWFYGLLSINTLLRGDIQSVTQQPREFPLPFRNCIVLGFMLGEDGNKMSKKLRNYREPTYIFDTLGADAMRWYFFSAQVPWTSTRFVEANIRDSQREFLIKLYNVLSFFTIYANIDGYAPGAQPDAPATRPPQRRSELDRWIISELHRTTALVRERMDAFENFPAAQRLAEFVDALSNWYVRRSRERYWRAGMDADKRDAYDTLHECLLTTARLMAPFTPYFAEFMYQHLTLRGGARGETDAPLSVHLCDYPEVDAGRVDETLSDEMAVVRDIVSLGRAARSEARLRTRQPLALVEIVLANPAHAKWLATHEGLLRDELNVKSVEFTPDADHYVTYQVKPNFKTLGPKFRALQGKIKAALAAVADPAGMRRQLQSTGTAALSVDGQTVELSHEDVQVELSARPGWAAAEGRTAVVVLKTELTEALRHEGLAREIVHHVQQIRKDLALRYEQRIELAVVGDETLSGVAQSFGDYISGETLATTLQTTALPECAPRNIEIDGAAVQLFVRAGQGS